MGVAVVLQDAELGDNDFNHIHFKLSINFDNPSFGRGKSKLLSEPPTSRGGNECIGPVLKF